MYRLPERPHARAAGRRHVRLAFPVRLRRTRVERGQAAGGAAERVAFSGEGDVVFDDPASLPLEGGARGWNFLRW